MGEDRPGEYLDEATDGNPIIAISEIVDLAVNRVNNADSSAEKMREFSAVGKAVVELAQSSENPDRVISTARDQAGTLARNTSMKKDLVLTQIEEEVGELEKKKIEEQGGYRVDHGIGLDRFLEEHLDEVVKQKSTDHVDGAVLRWRFDEGERVETAEGVHYDHYGFFKKIAEATDRRVVAAMASEKAEDMADSDEEYAELSLGPEDRPWSRNSDKWNTAISGLVEDRSRTETVVGPRTEAWERIKDEISGGRAVLDLIDAVENTVIYRDEENNEIWIPTSIIGRAVDQVETSRRALQTELSERGVDTDELSGKGISEAVTRNGASARFWRLDADHADVPEPETVVDEIEDPTDYSPSRSGSLTRDTDKFGGAADDEEGKGET